jgi:hypothetical protein
MSPYSKTCTDVDNFGIVFLSSLGQFLTLYYYSSPWRFFHGSSGQHSTLPYYQRLKATSTNNVGVSLGRDSGGSSPVCGSYKEFLHVRSLCWSVFLMIW